MKFVGTHSIKSLTNRKKNGTVIAMNITTAATTSITIITTP
jgi:hypothetical protein